MQDTGKSQIQLGRGQYSAIARSIPSKRSKTGHVSRQYVFLVLTGQITINSPTTREIKRKAEEIEKVLNSQSA